MRPPMRSRPKPLTRACQVVGDDDCAATNEDAQTISARRKLAGIQETVRHRAKCCHTLEMIDELSASNHRPPRSSRAPATGKSPRFVKASLDAESTCVLAAKSSTAANLGTAIPKRRNTLQVGSAGFPIPAKRTPLKALAVAAGCKQLHQETWRHGSKTSPGDVGAAMKSRFPVIRLRPSNRDISLSQLLPGGSLVSAAFFGRAAAFAAAKKCQLAIFPDFSGLLSIFSARPALHDPEIRRRSPHPGVPVTTPAKMSMVLAAIVDLGSLVAVAVAEFSICTHVRNFEPP